MLTEMASVKGMTYLDETSGQSYKMDPCGPEADNPNAARLACEAVFSLGLGVDSFRRSCGLLHVAVSHPDRERYPLVYLISIPDDAEIRRQLPTTTHEMRTRNLRNHIGREAWKAGMLCDPPTGETAPPAPSRVDIGGNILATGLDARGLYVEINGVRFRPAD